MATTNLANPNRYKAPISPRLPVAPAQYDQQYTDQLANILRLYFSQLDSLTSTLVGDDSTIANSATSNIGPGGRFIRMPYGAFSSDQDQLPGVTGIANTATLMTLNTTDFSNTVTISSSKITAKYAGLYNLQFSVQLENLSNAPQDVFIWLKQNGTDIVGSSGKIGMPARKSVGDPFHGIYGWNYFVNLTAGQYIEIYWTSSSTDVTIQYYAASASPTKPSTQSVVATMQFVSAPAS